jgi:charged multivesicular body protein 2A
VNGLILLTLGIAQLGETPTGLQKNAQVEGRVAEAIGGGSGDDDLQARLDSLRR